MIDRWLTIPEMLAVNCGELPASAAGLNRHIIREGWRDTHMSRQRATGQGGGYEYHASLLPASIQARLAETALTDKVEKEKTAALWARFESLSSKQKETCKSRLNALHKLEELLGAGMSKSAAFELAARDFGISPTSLRNWRKQVEGHPRQDWLAALAPAYKNTNQRAEIHADAWAAMKSDYLRYEGPTFSACYWRVQRAAKEQGWGKLPGERACRRRLDAEVPAEAQIMARTRRDVSKTLYPAQRRDRTALHAMQAVNADGHKFDVFVMPRNSNQPARMYLMAFQDLYSGKIVAWRLAWSENKETVRLAIGDMVQEFGIPDDCVLDNGRSFASKWITGGTATRFRFKLRDEEPQGLLTALGVKIHWATPYSGQSKPIERAFRDLADWIAKHPLCAGAYTGNRPDKKPENYMTNAIAEDVFREHVAREIEAFNAKTGRRAKACAGRSFDQTFEDSMAQPETIVRWPSEGQRSLWMLAAEQIRCSRGNGEIALFENRYWAPALTGFAGKRVTVRFDPDYLFGAIKVYDSEDRLICEARCIDDTGFFDTDAARDHNRKRRHYLKTVKEQARLHAELSADELARIYASEEEPKGQPKRPKVVRIANAAAAAAKPAHETEEQQFRDNLFRGLEVIQGGRDD